MKTKRIICLLAALTLLSGCSRGRELRREGFIRVIGADTDSEQTVSLRLFNSDDVYSAKGKTLFSAMENCEAIQEKQFFPGHLEVFVSSAQGLKSNLLTLFHNNRISPSCYVLCTDGSAAEFVKNNNEDFSRLIESSGRSGHIVPKSISAVLSDLLEDDRRAAVPVMSDNRLKMAVVSSDRLLGILTDEESQGLCWLCGTMEDIYMPIETDKFRTDFYIRKSRTKIDTEKRGDRIAVTAEIKINGSCENGSIPDDEIKDSAAKIISSLCSRTIAKTVTGMKADLFGIGRSLKAKRIACEETWSETVPRLDFYYKIKIAE